MNQQQPILTQWTGAGLVIANMIGAGVLLSTGFMAQEMGPGPILVAWVVGLGIALCGVAAYGGVAIAVAESGGEYRYLSSLVHPFAGYLAGWGSLVLGFSCPVAVDALAIGAFFNTLTDGPDPRLTGAAVILALAVAHAFDLRWAKWSQNVLVLIKLAFLICFLCIALVAADNHWPTWQAPRAPSGYPLRELITNQFWIAFAFSGWNAAVYAAGEFRRPRRDVPLAMLFGCSFVGALYLAINWVFVANITPQQATVVFNYETSRITLGHVIASRLFGEAGGQTISIFVIVAFISAISAMTMVGPRVYAAMARDGYLPRLLAGRPGRPPLSSIALQTVVSLLLVFTHTLLQAVQAASAFIMAFSALTAASLFSIGRSRPDLPAPARWRLAAAAIYTGAVSCILCAGLDLSGVLWFSMGGVVVVALVVFAFTSHTRG